MIGQRDRTMRRLARMFSSGLLNDPTAGDTAGGGGGGTPQPATTVSVLVPQERVNEIAAKARDEGRNAAAAELAKTLGVPLDQVSDIVKAHQAAESARMTEAEKLAKAAAEDRAVAAAERAQAAAMTRTATATAALSAAGLPGDWLATYAPVVLAGLPEGSDEAAVKAAVEAFKAGAGAPLFSAASVKPPAHGPNRTPGATSPGSTSALQAGREAAAKRFQAPKQPNPAA